MSSVMAYSDDGQPMSIRVIAPASLGEGYTFDVLVDDAPYTVEVPPGGVKEGQEFEVLYEPHLQQPEERQSTHLSYQEEDQVESQPHHDIEEDIEPAPSTYSEDRTKIKEQPTETTEDEEEVDPVTGAPIGRWRHSLCSCCDVLTQSTFWMGLCCAPVLMAQLITRFGLTWRGREGSKEEISLSYNKILISMMFALAFWKIPVAGDIGLLVFYLFVVVYVGSQVRAYVRQKYQIPYSSKYCHKAEDKCCMLLCGCCNVIQMARHTHDDKEYPGHGCTTTGLGVDAPLVV